MAEVKVELPDDVLAMSGLERGNLPAEVKRRLAVRCTLTAA
ncbi:MAG: hypothetical protein AB1556_02220 [Bacillota bacterium]